MRTPVRCGAIAALGLTAIAGLGTAWACVPQPLISLDPGASGAAGTEVTVVGQDLPSEGTAEIRWNGPQGTVLAKASGSSFSQPVTIPPAAPGLYGIVVVSRAADGSLSASGSAAFLVTDGSKAPAAAPAQPGSGAPTTGSQASSSTSRGGPPAALLVLGGAGFTVLGAAGATFFVGRRRSAPSPA